MKKEKALLADYDILDINEVIFSIEKSFDIKFNQEELNSLTTYGEFENLALIKIKGIETNDCTSQQAFYKLRKILHEEFNIPIKNILLNTKLTDIFPEKNRISNIKKLKKLLKYEGNILTFSGMEFIILGTVFISSIVLFFFNSFYGLLLFAIGLILSEEMKANTFLFKDIRELTNNLKTENYKNSRRDPKTYNSQEIKQAIKDIFSESLIIEKSKICHDSVL